ncbi:BppU family phage baseplate upper protein [Listeria innocua]|nr:BppU family phage baseplate upper protein [Listeria innocua]EKM0849550.1 BppU family phage baseplate upper protein [Listeria innocua]EKM6505842.1 BppU family phage baseplate upper protein [Listeria innocua]
MSALRKINATLDLNRKTWNIERIEAVQGDIDSLMLAVQIVENGKLKNLTGYKATFAVVLPDTINYVIDDLHFSNEKMNEGYFEYTFVKEAFSVAGVYDTARFILQNEAGTELSGMPRFTYYVEKDPLQGKVVAESYVSDFERLEALIHDVELEIDSLHTEIDKESARLNTEIEKIDAKIDTETSKLQSEADDLQQQFDNINPEQFVKKSGDILTGALQFDGIPTIFQAKQSNAWWYRLTSENSTTYQQSLFPTIVSGINGVQGAGYNFNQAYLRFKGVDVETITGSQAKADKALVDAKANAATLYEPKITKTEWTAPTLNTGFSILDTRFPPLYRLKGSTLQIKGAVGRTSATGTIFVLPAGFRPSERRGFSVGMVTSASGTVATVYVHDDGRVELVAASGNYNVWIEITLDID